MAASLAPSFASIFSEWQTRRLASALRKLGFAHVSETAVGEPFFRLALADGAASVALEGPAEVFEIIAR